MVSTRCPCCEESTQLLKIGTVSAYCDVCGWNVADALERLALRRRVIYSVLIFYALILSAGIPFARSPLGDVYFLIGTVALGAIFARTRGAKDSSRLAGVYKRIRLARTRQRVVPKPDAATSTQLEEVRALARPRPVQRNGFARSRRKPLIVPFVISFAVISVLWETRYSIFPNVPISSREAHTWAIYILGSAAILWFLFRRASANKRALSLLKNGEVALGRVIGPLVGSFPTPGITYEFWDSKGHFVCASGADIQGAMEECAFILVFYDSERPEKCIALCTTDYEVAKS